MADARRRWALWLGLAVFLAFIPALGMIPYHSTTPADSASAASLAGYDNSLAYWLVAGIAILGLAAFAIGERRGLFPASVRDHAKAFDQNDVSRPRVRPLAIAAVAAGALLIQCPFFLARYGPYREDSYFLSVLQRMHAGQRPYVDFESLYGPLMLYLPYGWSKLAGFSMTSYLALIALMDAALVAVLAAIVQRHVSGGRARFLVFLAMAPAFYNVKLGMNSNCLRRMIPVFALLVVAHGQKSRRTACALGVLIGVAAAYSHEYAAFALAGVCAVYGLEFLRRPSWGAFAAPTIVGSLALATWAACSAALLGPLFPNYVAKVVFGAARYSRFSCFAFSWTVHSLVTFALLAVAVAVTGRGLGRPRDTPLASGDRLFFGATACALIALRGGLIRVDMWHLAAATLGLIPAFLFPLPRNVFTVTAPLRRLAAALIVAMVATYLAGMTPPAEYVLDGLVRGARDVITGRRFTGEIATRAPSIEGERTEPLAEMVDLGRYLAEPVRAGRPVVPYSMLWYIDKRAGFVKQTYPTDDYLLDDAEGDGIREFLESHDDALVVMRDDVHVRLLADLRGEELPVTRVFVPTPTKRLLAWLSTTEYEQGELEQIQKERQWERTIGRWVVARYRVVERFGPLLVLARH